MENLKSILQIVLWISIPVFVLAALVTVILHYRRRRKLLNESELELPGVELPGDPTSRPTIPLPKDSGDSSRLIRQYSAKLEAADAIIAGLKGEYTALEKRYTQLLQNKSSPEEEAITVKQLQNELLKYRSQLKDLRSAYAELEKEEEAHQFRIEALQSELESVTQSGADRTEDDAVAFRAETAKQEMIELKSNHAAALAAKEAELQAIREEKEQLSAQLEEHRGAAAGRTEELARQLNDSFSEQMNNKDAELQALREQKDQMQKEIENIRSELQQHHLSELTNLRDQLRQEYLEQIEIKDVSIAALEQSRTHLQQELEDTMQRQQDALRNNSELVTHEVEENYRQQLSAKDAAHEQLRQHAAELKEKVDSFYYIEDLMKEKAQQIAFFENQIAQRVRQVHETEKHYQDTLGRLKEAEELNNLHSARISELQQSVEELQNKSEAFEQAKNEKEAALSQLNALVSEKTQYLENLERSLQQHKENNQNLEKDLSDYQQKNSDYQKRLQEMEGKLKISSNVLARIYSDLGKSFASIFTEDEHHMLEDNTVEFIELNGQAKNGEVHSSNGLHPVTGQHSEKI